MAQVLTSCNSTRDELAAEFCGPHGGGAPAALRRGEGIDVPETTGGRETMEAVGAPDGVAEMQLPVVTQGSACDGRNSSASTCERRHGGDVVDVGSARFELLDWVRTYPTFRFGGVEGTRVCTVAFRRLDGV